MYVVKGYCAGILIFDECIERAHLAELLVLKREELNAGNLRIQFAMGMVQVATEICIDVYEKEKGNYRFDLSVAYKRT